MQKIDPIAVTFADDGQFPNSRYPVLVYPKAIEAREVSPERLEALFAGNGWPPQWRSGIYPFHHYHSTAHECLGVARGSATVMLGGPNGREFHLGAGDVVVIPAGVAHQRIMASADFLVVGAYPRGHEDWDIRRGNPEDRPKADHNIANVPLPESDPAGGPKGALLRLWRGVSPI